MNTFVWLLIAAQVGCFAMQVRATRRGGCGGCWMLANAGLCLAVLVLR